MVVRIPSPAVEFDEIYGNAQSLVHYGCQISEKRLDIQGSSFKLYDHEIATTDLLVNDASLDSKEVNFCPGILSCIAIDECKSKHTCNKYCDMMSLKMFNENGIWHLNVEALVVMKGLEAYSVILPWEKLLSGGLEFKYWKLASDYKKFALLLTPLQPKNQWSYIDLTQSVLCSL